jgi:hypothetical protein
VIHLTLILVKVWLTKLAAPFPHGIAAEPDPSRQLQEKAGGVTPAGLFSWVRAGLKKTARGRAAVCCELARPTNDGRGPAFRYTNATGYRVSALPRFG